MADSPKSFHLPTPVHEYLVAHGSPPDPLQQELIEETQRLGGISLMQIAPEQGAFMTLLTRAIGARRAVEVGTFTGYSAICIARGLPEDGHLLCCDVSEEWTTIAQRYFEKAGVADRIELRIAPGAQTLASLPVEETLDLAFIDADKPGYCDYYEACLRLVRPGGLIAADNVLYGGKVAETPPRGRDPVAIHAFNQKLKTDDRVSLTMLPIGDGITLARKRVLQT